MMRRLLAPLAVLVLLPILLAAPARAGGPTSVLLSVAGSGRTASLYYTQPRYDELSRMVGVTASSGPVDGSGAGHEHGAGVTLTWLIHDIDPWRIDRVYLGGADGVWIGTQETDGASSPAGSPVTWHRPAHPARLVALLDELGLADAARSSGSFGGVPGAPVDRSERKQVAAGPSTRSSALPAGLGGLVGLGLGTALGITWQRRRRPALHEPTGPGGSRNATSEGVEQLSWPAPTGRRV